MPATINSLLNTYSDDNYFTDAFYTAIYSFIPYLKKLTVTYQTPTNNILYKYTGDFYGLLDSLGIAKKYHYAVMLFNGLTDSGNYDPAMNIIQIPNLEEIDMLHSTLTATS